MDPITIVLLVIFGLIALLLIGLVLIQNDNSEGMGGIFGGGANNQVGNRRGNILTRTTSILGALFLGVCVLFAFTYRDKEQTAEQIQAQTQDLSAGKQEVQEWWKNEVPPPPAAEPTVTDPAAEATDLEAPATETTN